MPRVIRESISIDAPPQYALIKMYAYNGTDLVYEGWANPGTATSAAAWSIRKNVYGGSPSSLSASLWADGNTDFDNVWDNRASLNYS